LLKVDGLSGGYSGIRVLWNISLEVGQGELVGIIGPNGAGKTTLLKSIAGLVKPYAGEVWLLGERVTRLPAHVLARKGVALVPEGRELFPYLTVEEHLKLGARLASLRGEDGDAELALELFPSLKGRLRQRAGTLSGGEQQMLAIARALASRPRLLMLDEPSTGLSPLVVKELVKALGGLRSKAMGLLLVEQNVRVALSLCDRLYVLEKGKVAYSGTSKELLEHEAIRQAYLGV